jgi:5-oxoprolinase (ATP-hydrolysing)
VRRGLRYDGADAVLAIEADRPDVAKIRFEEAHQRLFGFVEPDRRIIIARVEVEGAPFPPPRGEGGSARQRRDGSGPFAPRLASG